MRCSLKGSALKTIVYTGPLEDSREVIQFLRREAADLRILRKAIVSPDKTVVKDVNGDGIDSYRAVWGTSSVAQACAVSQASVWSDRAVWGTDTSQADLSWTVINGE